MIMEISFFDTINDAVIVDIFKKMYLQEEAGKKQINLRFKNAVSCCRHVKWELLEKVYTDI